MSATCQVEVTKVRGKQLEVTLRLTHPDEDLVWVSPSAVACLLQELAHESGNQASAAALAKAGFALDDLVDAEVSEDKALRTLDKQATRFVASVGVGPAEGEVLDERAGVAVLFGAGKQRGVRLRIGVTDPKVLVGLKPGLELSTVQPQLGARPKRKVKAPAATRKKVPQPATGDELIELGAVRLLGSHPASRHRELAGLFDSKSFFVVRSGAGHEYFLELRDLVTGEVRESIGLGVDISWNSPQKTDEVSCSPDRTRLGVRSVDARGHFVRVLDLQGRVLGEERRFKSCPSAFGWTSDSSALVVAQVQPPGLGDAPLSLYVLGRDGTSLPDVPVPGERRAIVGAGGSRVVCARHAGGYDLVDVRSGTVVLRPWAGSQTELVAVGGGMLAASLHSAHVVLEALPGSKVPLPSQDALDAAQTTALKSLLARLTVRRALDRSKDTEKCLTETRARLKNLRPTGGALAFTPGVQGAHHGLALFPDGRVVVSGPREVTRSSVTGEDVLLALTPKKGLEANLEFLGADGDLLGVKVFDRHQSERDCQARLMFFQLP